MAYKEVDRMRLQQSYRPVSVQVKRDNRCEMRQLESDEVDTV